MTSGLAGSRNPHSSFFSFGRKERKIIFAVALKEGEHLVGWVSG